MKQNYKTIITWEDPVLSGALDLVVISEACVNKTSPHLLIFIKTANYVRQKLWRR